MRWHVPAVFYGVQELLDVHQGDGDELYRRSEV